MGINIERNGQFLTVLNVKLLDAILTEKTEHTFTRVLSRNFNHILLRHPGISCTL